MIEAVELRLKPLVVDLDGTLLRSDMLLENALWAVAHTPMRLLSGINKLVVGKAQMKEFLAQGFEFEPACLPYDASVLAHLRAEQAIGRQLVLCTATNEAIAKKIAEHLGLFTEVIASDATMNLSSTRKANALVERFGVGGFDYIGNSHDDLAVWEQADQALVANASAAVLGAAKAHGNVKDVFEAEQVAVKTFLKAIRVHQWVKNLLVLVPILAAHRFADVGLLITALMGFFAFSFTASGVYLVNDLLDLEADRHHPSKCNRAFASGKIGLGMGVALSPLFFIAGMAIATAIGVEFLLWLLVYAALTTAYSFRLKKVALFDCFTLSGLYTLRILAGGVVLDQSVSLWLLSMSMFLFLSLAFVKRFSEIVQQIRDGKQTLMGRGYRVEDGPIIMALGVAAGFAAALIMGLYISSGVVRELYTSPAILALTVPVITLWISWIWIKAARGEMNEDPVLFAFKDRLSLLAGAIFGAVMFAGTIDW
jgi:4-hydroxybenzoate polyprenyltransferase